MKLIFALTYFITSSHAHKIAPIIHAAAERHDQDKYLISAVVQVESRFTRILCHKGAYGYMQIQIRDKSCSHQAYLRAGWLNLHSAWYNFDRGAALMAYWKNWCNKHHGKQHHWLLHYNQGYGKCPHGIRKCTLRQRLPIMTGEIGGYARRVLMVYRLLKARSRYANST